MAIVAAIAPAALRAQQIVIAGDGNRSSAAIIREASAKNHVVRGGTGRLDFPRDSVISSTLIVVGRPTYLASKVNGDVVVIGGDLFLHPGADVNGRAVAIGGTVVLSSLARVSGSTESILDETYISSASNGSYSLTYQNLRTETQIPIVDYAGLQGFLIPAYDRVDGLSLPVGAVVTLAQGTLLLEPRLTYRSRLGVIDPRIDITLAPEGTLGFEGTIAKDTRSNDAWIRSDLINSVTTLFAGSDVRNYFRSSGGMGRAVLRTQSTGLVLSTYIGGRFERVEPITAGGNVFSFTGRKSIEKMARPNPLVERGNIGSALLGGELYDTAGVVASRVRGQVERSLTTMTGTSSFTQFTLDVRVAFPTFRTQSLAFKGHAVTSSGSAVPRSRYAYLGGSGTLPVLENLELGGDELVFLESEYTYPLETLILPFVGSPVLSFRHIMGSAGVSKLPSLEQEIGAGVGLKIFHADVNTDVGGNRGTKLGFGFSLTL